MGFAGKRMEYGSKTKKPIERGIVCGVLMDGKSLGTLLRWMGPAQVK